MKYFGVIALWLFMLSAFAGTETGNGGIGVESNGGLTLRDIIRGCEWQAPGTVIAPLKSLDRIFTSIDKVNYLLSYQLDILGNKLFFCFTKHDLKTPPESIREHVVKFIFKNKTIGYKKGDRVYVNKKLYNQLSDYEKSLFYIHEVAHGLFTRSGRQENVEDLIELIHQNHNAPMSKKLFNQILAKMNPKAIDTDSFILNNEQYRKDILVILEENDLADKKDKLKYSLGIKIIKFIKKAIKTKSTPYHSEAMEWVNKNLKESGRKSHEFYQIAEQELSTMNKGLYDIVKEDRVYVLERMIKDGLTVDAKVQLTFKCDRILSKHEIDHFSEFKKFSANTTCVKKSDLSNNSSELETKLINLAKLLGANKIFNLLEAHGEKSNSEFYSVEEKKKVNLLTKFFEVLKDQENKKHLEYWGNLFFNAHSLISVVDLNLKQKIEYNLPKINVFRDKAPKKHQYISLFEVLLRQQNRWFYEQHRDITFGESNFGNEKHRFFLGAQLPEETSGDDRYFIRPKFQFKDTYQWDESGSTIKYSEYHRQILQIQKTLIKFLKIENFNYFAEVDLNELMVNIFEDFDALVSSVSSVTPVNNTKGYKLKYAYTFSLVAPIWEAVLDNKLLIKNVKQNTLYRYKKGTSISLLKTFTRISSGGLVGHLGSFCKVFTKLTKSELLNMRIFHATKEQILKDKKLKNTKFCKYRDLIQAIESVKPLR